MARQLTCVCAECGRIRLHQGRGLCGMCRKRLVRAGTLDERYPKSVLSYAARATIFMETYGRDECWPWPKGTNNGGYGPHRAMYRAARGPIPYGLALDHLTCERRDCVNPWHLDATSHRANNLRSDSIAAKNLAKERCPNEHQYDKMNNRGDRVCGTCDRVRQRARKRAKRLGVPYVDPFKTVLVPL